MKLTHALPKITIHALGTASIPRRDRTRLIDSKWFCGTMALALAGLVKWGAASIMSLNSL